MKNRSARLVCCLLIGSLSGCLNLDPKPDPARYYTLAPIDFVKSPSGRLEVEVSQLPYYAKTKMVGDTGVEPATSCVSCKRSNQLS
jgi:hypothetical protein